MLVLTRKLDQSFKINGDIEVKVVEINGDKVKLGIAAPKSYTILRSELLDTVAENKQAAASRIQM
ncbi:MAG: carbon storage regulator CsrA [Oscillospiraceae bacterium]|jgi:carbon storage regulator|nr:carbon storage regulator CsrA [Oscillospiraceae bacterium]